MTSEKAIECINFQNEKFFGGQSEALKIAILAINTIELIKSSSSFTNLQKTAIEEMMRGE